MSYRNREGRRQEKRTVIAVRFQIDGRIRVQDLGYVVAAGGREMHQLREIRENKPIVFLRRAGVIKRVARADRHELREPSILESIFNIRRSLRFSGCSPSSKVQEQESRRRKQSQRRCLPLKSKVSWGRIQMGDRSSPAHHGVASGLPIYAIWDQSKVINDILLEL